jgi:chromosome segregation ATPase
MFNKNVTKNSLVVMAVLTAITALIGFDLMWSYWQGIQGVVHRELRDATSIEFDLVRLDQAIEALTPVIRKNRKVAANRDVEIEFLQSDTDVLEKKRKVAKSEMQELRNTLTDKEANKITIDGREYTRVEVEEDLSRRLRAYEQTEKQLNNRTRLLEKQRAALASAIASIRDNEQKQIELAEQADSLNAELKLLQIASATSQFQLQQPKLAKTNELATEIEKRIRTLQKLSDEEEKGQKIPVNQDRRTVTERFDSYFKGQPQ